jgi:hypothetical protein
VSGTSWVSIPWPATRWHHQERLPPAGDDRTLICCQSLIFPLLQRPCGEKNEPARWLRLRGRPQGAGRRCKGASRPGCSRRRRLPFVWSGRAGPDTAGNSPAPPDHKSSVTAHYWHSRYPAYLLHVLAQFFAMEDSGVSVSRGVVPHTVQILTCSPTTS